MSSDAIVILKADHKEIRDQFRKFQAAGDKAVKTKERIAGQIIELLTVHTYIENEVMYPEVCALLPDLKDDVLESYEEHHVADVLCMTNPLTPVGKVVDVGLEVWGVFVITVRLFHPAYASRVCST